MLNNFDVNIWDVETRIVKPKTIIGDRAYCEATAGKEFWVVVRVLDMAMHKKLNPTGEVHLYFLPVLFTTHPLIPLSHMNAFKLNFPQN